MNRFLLYTYAITLFLSAALIFSVQPLFSKMILPLLGGTPQVWNTAMLFFQFVLLLGYFYAHTLSTYFKTSLQIIIHLALLILFIGSLPFYIPADAAPPMDGSLSLWQVSLMFSQIGGAFFILSASAPLFQHWFSKTSHPDAPNPYFLYGASNLGSMGALLSYPVLIEPHLNIGTQADVWMYGYWGICVFTVLCAVILKASASKSSQDVQAKKEVRAGNSPSFKRCLTWVCLAFVPSSLMLGTTSFITTDIASVPLMWIIPFALYVGSFIIVFSRREIITFKGTQSLFIAAVCFFIICNVAITKLVHTPYILLLSHFVFFAACALLCHKKLADLKPDARYLTAFYFMMSIGGVLGGFFNAIIAPAVFNDTYEYLIVALLAIAIWHGAIPKPSFKRSLSFLDQNYLPILLLFSALLFNFSDYILPSAAVNFALLAYVFYRYRSDKAVLAFAFVVYLCSILGSSYVQVDSSAKILRQDRNFFGVLKVTQTDTETSLLHGTTLHGMQLLQEENRLTPISYYSRGNPISDVFEHFDKSANSQRIGVIGLGSGVTACYSHKGRVFDFYEIDKNVVEVAEDKQYFTYLSDCGSPYKIILGDARLSLKAQSVSLYDILIIDAFSSDSIPVHLMTFEAIQDMQRVIKPDGVLLFHISNRHMDLEPVLQAAGAALGMTGMARINEGGKLEGGDIPFLPSHYAVLTKNLDIIDVLKQAEWRNIKSRKNFRLWTDSFSNILSVLQLQNKSIKQDHAE
ncbi:MAG: fused MFS/spermidine synthase [Alphaproteobacteria bacterium]